MTDATTSTPRVLHTADRDSYDEARRNLSTEKVDGLVVMDWLLGRREHFPVIIFRAGRYVGSAHTEEEGRAFLERGKAGPAQKDQPTRRQKRTGQ